MTDAKTILIVDDDPDFRLPLRLQLEAAGYTVVEACDRDEAHATIAAQRPAAVIQDLMMDQPDTGFTLCYEMKRHHPDLPIIMVTGVASETGIEFETVTEEERSWIKADVILAKPIRFEQLKRELDRLL